MMKVGKPDKFIENIAFGAELSINLRRKISLASEKLQEVIEIE